MSVSGPEGAGAVLLRDHRGRCAAGENPPRGRYRACARRCNGSLALAPLPPFPLSSVREPAASGRRSRRRWAESSTQAAGNVCDSGKAACMTAVVAEMSQRIASLRLQPPGPVRDDVPAGLGGDQGERDRPGATAIRPTSFTSTRSFATFYYHALDAWLFVALAIDSSGVADRRVGGRGAARRARLHDAPAA